MSRTVSARIPTELHEELRERCNLVGESINDYVTAAIEFALHESVDFDFGNEELEEEPQVKVSFVEKEKPTAVIAHGKLLDDYGNVIGTF